MPFITISYKFYYKNRKYRPMLGILGTWFMVLSLGVHTYITAYTYLLVHNTSTRTWQEWSKSLVHTSSSVCEFGRLTVCRGKSRNTKKKNTKKKERTRETRAFSFSPSPYNLQPSSTSNLQCIAVLVLSNFFSLGRFYLLYSTLHILLHVAEYERRCRARRAAGYRDIQAMAMAREPDSYILHMPLNLNLSLGSVHATPCTFSTTQTHTDYFHFTLTLSSQSQKEFEGDIKYIMYGSPSQTLSDHFFLCWWRVIYRNWRVVVGVGESQL